MENQELREKTLFTAVKLGYDEEALNSFMNMDKADLINSLMETNNACKEVTNLLRLASKQKS